MKRDLSKWSLVVVGKWNTAILSPDWLAEKVFGEPQVKIMYPVLGGGPPIFEGADIRVTVTRNFIAVAPMKDTDALLKKIEEAVMRVLDTLSHTPIAAFGENFHYLVETPPDEIAKTVKVSDAESLGLQGRIEETSVRRSIALSNCTLNVTICSGVPFRVDLNYHYDIHGATEASGKMKGTFVSNRDHGLSLLQSVYGLSLDEEV